MEKYYSSVSTTAAKAPNTNQLLSVHTTKWKYICIYLEYHSVCPLVLIGTPNPASEYDLLTEPKGLPAGEGLGAPYFDDWKYLICMNSTIKIFPLNILTDHSENQLFIIKYGTGARYLFYRGLFLKKFVPFVWYSLIARSKHFLLFSFKLSELYSDTRGWSVRTLQICHRLREVEQVFTTSKVFFNSSWINAHSCDLLPICFVSFSLP